MRQADLLQLEQIAAGYPSRERFLTELTLDPPDATSDQAGVPLLDEDYLILSTIHSAKGQEWKSVFVLNVVDGCMPSDLGTGTTAEIEEERRLLYVAMTRAKDTLHLIMPQRFFTHGQSRIGDRHVYASRTRFIPGSLLPLFESVTWPIVATEVAGGRRSTRFASMSARGCAVCGGESWLLLCRTMGRWALMSSSLRSFGVQGSPTHRRRRWKVSSDQALELVGYGESSRRPRDYRVSSPQPKRSVSRRPSWRSIASRHCWLGPVVAAQTVRNGITISLGPHPRWSDDFTPGVGGQRYQNLS